MKASEPSCPSPGIYEDVPFEDYLSWDAISSGRLKLAAKSLAHFKASPQLTETGAIRLGSLVHCGRLEPLELAKRYAVMPAYELDDHNKTASGEQSTSKATKYYRTKRQEFMDANDGKTLIESAEYDRMLAMVKSLSGNELASEVLGGEGPVEVSIVWEDAETGLRCKGRFDKLQISRGRFADLKSCRDCLRFERQIIDLGYHRQAAFYRWGYSVLTGEILEPWLVPVESSEPYPCMAAPVDSWLIDDGWKGCRESLNAVAEAIATDTFPSYANPDRWFAPTWYSNSDQTSTPVEVTIGGEKVLI